MRLWRELHLLVSCLGGVSMKDRQSVWGWLGVVALLSGGTGAAAEQIVLEEAGAKISAPETITCDALPALSLEGDLGTLFGGDRGVVNRLVGAMGQALQQACPDLASIGVEGADRGVSFRFEVTAEGNWVLPGGAPDAAPEPAEPEAPETAAAAPVPETGDDGEAAVAAAAGAPDPAEPAEAAEPEVAPGLAFNDLARFFGPVPTIRGHAKLEAHETWTRILAARAYAHRPSLIEDDMTALEVAKQMLNPAEFQQVFGAYAQTIGQGPRADFRRLSVFDRRDLATRVRAQLRQFLDQRRQTGWIDVFHVVPTRLGEYSFETGAFPLDLRNGRNYRVPAWQSFQVQGALNSVVMPTELRASAEQARQLDTYLRARNDRTLYLGVFLSIDPRVPPSVAEYSGYRGAATPARLTQIALFADENLTQIVFDFTDPLADRHRAVAAVSAELARPIANGETLLKSIAALSDAEEALDAVVEAAASNPYGADVSPDSLRATARATLDRTPARKLLRFGGTLQLSPYDSMLGGMPVRYFSPQHGQFEGFQLQMALQPTFFPNVTLLPMDEATAARVAAALARNGQAEIRLEAELVQGSYAMPSDGYVQMNATFAPQRLLLFSGNQNGIAADRELLAEVAFDALPGGGSAPFELIRIDE